jgi:hypothetical protein
MEQTLESLKNYKGQHCPFTGKFCQEAPCSGCVLYPLNKKKIEKVKDENKTY